MKYNLKDKIEVTEEFLANLISKSWQETEAIQQQIANLDTSSQLGMEVARLLKNTCTNYYILIGCLEALTENPGIAATYDADTHQTHDTDNLTLSDTCLEQDTDLEPEFESEAAEQVGTTVATDFEPFEYFVDFDEPSGEPLSDEDLYGN